jgi:hypothetical protein
MFDKEEFQKAKEYYQKEYEEANIKEKEELKETLRYIAHNYSYKKGEITKEVFNLPMPTSKEFLSKRGLNIKIYGYLMLNSNWGGKYANCKDRYLYKDKWDEVIKNACEDLNISQSTIKRHINKLKANDIKAIVLTKVDNKLVYKLNYGSFNTETGLIDKFVLIDNIALRKLVNAYSDYPLRIYLYMLYTLRNGEKRITQKTLCEVVGLSNNTRYVISDSVDALIDGGFINVRCEYENNLIMKNGVEVEHNTLNYYYSLCSDYLKDSKSKKR